MTWGRKLAAHTFSFSSTQLFHAAEDMPLVHRRPYRIQRDGLPPAAAASTAVTSDVADVVHVRWVGGTQAQLACHLPTTQYLLTPALVMASETRCLVNHVLNNNMAYLGGEEDGGQKCGR